MQSSTAESQRTTRIEAVRSDGSSVRIPDQANEIVDLRNRRIVRFEPLTQSKTTTSLTAAKVLLHQAAALRC